MKHLKTFLPTILAVLASLFSGTAYSADEKDDLLIRFDRELLTIMSGFAAAREEPQSSAFRQEYTGALNRFISDAATLQEIAVKLGIGEDLDLGVHARNIRNAFQEPVRTETSTSANTKQNKKKNNGPKEAINPIYGLTGKTLSEQTGFWESSDGNSGSVSIQRSQTPAGYSFRMAGNAVQTLSQLGFGLRNGKYSVSPKYRRILPYLELKRDVEYYNVSYEHFDTLISVPAWRNDFDKRLKRMVKLAIQIQPVYRTYFPRKSISLGGEAERLARVYAKFIEYVKAVEQSEQESLRGSNNTATYNQASRTTIPDRGAILRDYDTAASRFAEFFADMDSIDWTANEFSGNGSSENAGEAKSPAKSSN